MNDFTRESIVAAAIDFDGTVLSIPPPARHGDIIRLRATDPNPPSRRSGIQGFLTNTGRFVDRCEARDIAIACGQVDHGVGLRLFTEDLW